ncbi:MAG: hypothetical protein BWY76_02014 [bacterium ADurb.Bin429]|nr:MAG: hypothetical protein BWY76_02014 [bacterium ADurb.Bin429]
MGGAVFTDDAGAVKGEDHRIPLQADIVQDLIIRALQEGGVNGHDGAQAFARHAGRRRHRVFFGHAHIEEAVGKAVAEGIQAGAVAHRGADCHHARVIFRVPAGGGTEDFSEGVASAGFHRLPRFQIEDRHGMQAAVVILRRRVAFTLGGQDVQQHGPGQVAHLRQDIQQCGKIVAIYRTDVGEAQVFEEHAADDHLLETGFHLFQQCEQTPPSGQALQQGFTACLRPAITFVAAHAVQIAGQRADIRRNRHGVVIQDHQKIQVGVSGVIQRFQRHARAKRAVADDGNDVAGSAGLCSRARHAQRRGDGGAAMTGIKDIVRTFGAFGETGKAIKLAESGERATATSEQLMRINLVADIPDEGILGTIENVVQREREFDDAKICAQVTAGLRESLHQILPNLLRQLRQL